ncbi:universal stress protein [Pelodictyon luteolum]|uniref:UspA-related nucleotide-binding protein n=1 Tax=Chlorobium luteolum (strain DSM 273 / BCRC 81028 / 2530) TaxID=319225 RepID=Q3B4C5_CHLL3|nr:universal stress protein [Pelodictyon luteolum]ABB23806.1 UspA-related nucleotide-binding protein [Pelodictyon luteolum DSM 273]
MTHVLACIDGSMAATAVCDAAAWASRRLHAPLELLHVLEKPDKPAGGDLSGSIGFGAREHLLLELVALEEKKSRLLLEQGKAMLQAARERVEASGREPVTSRQLHGPLVDILEDLAGETRLCIMGREGESNTRAHRAIGSNLENVIRTLSRPVLIVLPGFRKPRSFMISFDGSPTAWKAIDMVAGSPLLESIPCHVVMAGKAADTRQNELTEACHKLGEHGFEVTDASLDGNAHDALLGYRREHDIDLMVMGAYGHSRIRQFLIGSTTTKMLASCEVPLLILR